VEQIRKDAEASFKSTIDSLMKENDNLRQEILQLQDAHIKELDDLKVRGMKRLDELEASNTEYQLQIDELRSKVETQMQEQANEVHILNRIMLQI
jgi:hypothetical protein